MPEAEDKKIVIDPKTGQPTLVSPSDMAAGQTIQPQPEKKSFLRNLLTNYLQTLGEDLSSGVTTEAIGQGIVAGTRRGGTPGQAFGATLATIPQAREALQARRIQEALRVQQAKSLEAQNEPVDIVDSATGKTVRLPAKVAGPILAADVRGRYSLKTAEVGAQSREKVAGMQVTSREKVAAQQQKTAKDVALLKIDAAKQAATVKFDQAKELIKLRASLQPTHAQKIQNMLEGLELRDEFAQKKEIRKAEDTAGDFDRLYRVMESQLKNIEASGKITGPESMVLLSHHIAMTFGGVKGARIGRDIIEAHLKARSLPEGMAVLAQKVVDGGTLSIEQAREFVRLARERRLETWRSVSEAAQRRGLEANVPEDLKPILGGTNKKGFNKPVL